MAVNSDCINMTIVTAVASVCEYITTIREVASACTSHIKMNRENTDFVLIITKIYPFSPVSWKYKTSAYNWLGCIQSFTWYPGLMKDKHVKQQVHTNSAHRVWRIDWHHLSRGDLTQYSGCHCILGTVQWFLKRKKKNRTTPSILPVASAYGALALTPKFHCIKIFSPS